MYCDMLRDPIEEKYVVKSEKKMSYISNLTTKVVGSSFTTEQMKEKTSSIISSEMDTQLDNLGVKNRFFANLGEQSITESCKIIAKEALGDHKINNIVVASEISDYQSPGIAPLLVNTIGDSFVNLFNLQGTACSTMPKALKLCENLEGNTLVVISGITSPIYQGVLEKLIKKNVEVEQKTPEWVALMFSFLMGDGLSSFIHSNSAPNNNDGFCFKHLGQVTNIKEDDFSNVYIDNQLFPHAKKGILKTPLTYADALMKKLKIDNLADYDKIILHTGSRTIIDSFKERYNLDESQVKASRYVLENYGNMTGCSLPFVLQHTEKFERALMIGISMGVSVDMVEVFPTQ